MYNQNTRVVSGMRPSGPLHIGNYHGVIKKWIELQYQYECYFIINDLNYLNTCDNVNQPDIETNIYNMVIEWLACGVDPSQANIFIQSTIPEHTELYTLLSTITPLSWLERSNTYKEILRTNPEHASFGLLGNTLLDVTNILLYGANVVAIGEDQNSNVEVARDIARRFNHLYGREIGFEEKAQEVIKKLGHKSANLYQKLLVQYKQNGDDESLKRAESLLIDESHTLSLRDKERLLALLKNKSKVILNEPQIVLTSTPKVIGLDGQRMSRKLKNSIALTDSSEDITKKINTMHTDPARIHLSDPGDPNKCPVWQLHQIYTNKDTLNVIESSCVNASIGCLQCKQYLITGVQQERKEFQERLPVYQNNPRLIKSILADGAHKAKIVAKETLNYVKQAIQIIY
jgi:tryptophanyl-tRNA synthetase